MGAVLVPRGAAETLWYADTRQHEFTSAHTGRTYQLRVGLPRNYDPVNRRYTVVYQLDGQWDFERTWFMTRALEYDHRIEPVIVVGITYGGDNPNYGELRQRDYVPNDMVLWGVRGEANAFLDTLRQEILPWVDGQFATRPEERVLMGSSLGGLFTSHALLRASDLFTGYVASSPSIWVNMIVMERDVATYRDNVVGRNLRLQIITGAAETLTQRNGAQRFYNALVAQDISDLTVELTFEESERHGAVGEMAYVLGLPRVLRPKLVPVWRGAGSPRMDWDPVARVPFSGDDVRREDGPWVGGASRLAMVFDPSSPARASLVSGAVYVLDGQWDQAAVLSNYGALDYDNEIGATLLVGVGWEGDPSDIVAGRRREFTPVDSRGDGAEGGASQFTEYIRERVIPDAERNLGSAPAYRMVVASEKGALWALADLFSGAPTFDRYLLVSPDVSWNDEYVLQLEADRAAVGGDLTARLRVYTGANEPAEQQEAVQRFLNQLRNRNYPGLSINHAEVPDAGYGVAKIIGYHKGLRLMSRGL